MPKRKKEELAIEKSQKEQMVDAILGSDEEMSEELAHQILASYGLNQMELLDKFKGQVREHLKGIPVESEESRRLGGMLRNVVDFQKRISGETLSPRQWISKLFGDPINQRSAEFAYSFRNREEGDLPDSDKAILDELRDELIEKEK